MCVSLSLSLRSFLFLVSLFDNASFSALFSFPETTEEKKKTRVSFQYTRRDLCVPFVLSLLLLADGRLTSDWTRFSDKSQIPHRLWAHMISERWSLCSRLADEENGKGSTDADRRRRGAPSDSLKNEAARSIRDFLVSSSAWHRRRLFDETFSSSRPFIFSISRVIRRRRCYCSAAVGDWHLFAMLSRL